MNQLTLILKCKSGSVLRVPLKLPCSINPNDLDLHENPALIGYILRSMDETPNALDLPHSETGESTKGNENEA